MSFALTLSRMIEPPDTFDPPALIRFAHEAAEAIGYVRVRADRGAIVGQTTSQQLFYYETGYGVGTVKVRFSKGPDWEVSRENYAPEKTSELVEMLEAGTKL